MRDCEAIVVGSGSGGLTAALALANAGVRVVVFEQNAIAGGYSQSFSLDGFSFSPGVHYIGQLQPGGRLREIYEGLGIANDLTFLELNPDGYDRVVIGDERFDIPKGRDHFAERLKQRFPSEADGIDFYMRTVSRMSAELQWCTPPQSIREMLTLPMRARTILRYGLRPLNRFLDRCTRDPLLRAILSIQAGDHGMAPGDAPTALHAGLQDYYFDGACYPRGGGHAIADALVKQIESKGGRVVLGKRVERILIENSRAIGVRLGDGTEVRADIVISNADPGVTWGQLIESKHQSTQLRKHVARLRYSLSTLSLFVAVDMDLRAAGLDSGNIWYSRTPDIDAAYRMAEMRDLSNLKHFPGLFFNVSTLKDPSLRNDGLHTVEIMALASYRSFAAWEGSQPGRRPKSYDWLKDNLEYKMLQEVDCFVPGFSDRVVFKKFATPLTNMHYVNATEGAIYGTRKSLRNLGPFSFPIRTNIHGLYQCGASTFAPGINGVTRSGLSAAAAALDCDEDDLLRSRGQTLKILPADDPASWPIELQPRGIDQDRELCSGT